ncbi:MAG: AraC family transcriptional regulator [Pleurocapsa sp. MO_226.B13]|nr:AraC family transcriptional regulator [Pleurocapsa sp. MO_226.B13]
MQPDSPESLRVDFVKEREEAYKRIYKRSPILSSHAVGWESLGIAYDWYRVEKVPKIISQQHAIGIFTDVPSPAITERYIDGRFKREQVVLGSCVIVPANMSQYAEWNQESGAITMSIDPIVFAQTIHEVVDPDTIELLPLFATPDPFIYQIGVALKSALTKHSTSSRLYAETLVNTLILHLLEHYCTNRPSLQEAVSGQLPRYKLQQVIDYINAYLERDLSLKELSNLLQMSPHYFSKLFKQSTGTTPHRYVIKCRIEKAKYLIRHSKLSLAEISTQVGFTDQSHLHRHFKRLVGVTPKVYFHEFH